MQVDIMTVLCAGHTIALAHWHTCCPHESDVEYEQRRASYRDQCPLCRATTPQPEESTWTA